MVSDREREELWTLDELTARVALALSVDYDGQPSGRVREVPDARVVRYYTTLGLVDRPVAYDGRIALYTKRHLLQIVAIKRLQQRGASLSEIQQGFLTLDERALERLAAAPAEATSAVPAISSNRPAPRDQEEASKEAPSRREGFWNAPPADAVTDAVVTRGAASAKAKAKENETPMSKRLERTTPPGGTLTGVPISGEAVLLAAFTRALEPEDLAAVQAAAAPLLEELERRGLL